MISCTVLLKRVRPRVTQARAKPGGIRYHHAPLVTAPRIKARFSMLPQLIRVGSPSPRKLRLASERIANETSRVTSAKMMGNTWGSTWMNTMPNVVVLMPPPVEPGDAPMNISTITKNSVALLSEAVFSVFKPAVLLVTERKSEESEKKYQSDLRSFVEERSKNPIIKISKLLPMKFGVRKRLQEDSIEFGIVDSDLHISIFNKVLIQVYTPRRVRDISFYREVQDLTEICELLLIVFDFVEFEEDYTGERRFLRNKIQELKSQESSQIIVIRNEEELFFIIQSVLESNKEGS